MPIQNRALDGWAAALRNELLDPLEMRNTYLDVPPNKARRVVSGYELALALAEVSDGQITQIRPASQNGFLGTYSMPPEVRIIGGGGAGVAADATLNVKGEVASVHVRSGGSGYIMPPTIKFAPTTITFIGLDASRPAMASAVISDGHVIGIEVLDPGSGYAEVPQMIISGGRRAGVGRDATATAHIANHKVSFVTVDDGGEGYEQPLSVVFTPGTPLQNSIPIWAPAGALSSTLRDMVRLAAAALGHTEVESRPMTSRITAGFTIAETPYACQNKGGFPELEQCKPENPQSGLAWTIEQADSTHSMPTIISKNGGLPGFSTQLMLMPDRDLAVVVFMNTRSGGTNLGEEISSPASIIARNILGALFYNLEH
jgi:CubicO group peptidase (beta-lactamase class C family)